MLRVSLRRLSSLFSTSKRRNPKKLQELLKGEKVSQQTILEINKKRTERAREQDTYNQKIKNYLDYEFFRGEDFIENVPYGQSLKYSIRDKLGEQEEKQRISIEQLAPMTNHLERAKLIREKINSYHDKQKKYEMEEFEKYLKQYPGTVKGPKPEDDWEAYKAYALKKMPRVLKDELIFNQADAKIKQDFNQEEVPDQEHPRIDPPSSILAFLGKDRIILDDNTSKQEQNAWFQQFRKGWEHQQMIDGQKLDVPFLPSVKFENYQHYFNHIQDWINFRNSYVEHNKQIIDKIASERQERITNSFLQGHQEYQQIECTIPSLYRYYKCLPKEMQDHPAMKDVYLGLQYSAPDYTNEEKEDALNRLCLKLLPFDIISQKAMEDYTAHKRVYFTQYLHEKVFTMHPQFTWDLDKFLEQLRQQELRGQISNENKQLRYPEPPEVHKMWEEGAPNLPVDFYDNQDGFWDPVISQKLRRYDAHKPMLKTRRLFKH